MVLPAFINSHVHSLARPGASGAFPFIAPSNPSPNRSTANLVASFWTKGIRDKKSVDIKLESKGRQSLVVNIFWFFQKSSRRLSCWCQLTLRSRPLQKGTATSLAWTINGVALLRNNQDVFFSLLSLLSNVLYCMLVIVVYWRCVFGQAVLLLQRVIDFLKNSEAESAAACNHSPAERSFMCDSCWRL